MNLNIKIQNAQIPTALLKGDINTSAEFAKGLESIEDVVRNNRGVVLYGKKDDWDNNNKISVAGAQFLRKWLNGPRTGYYLNVEKLEDCKKKWYEEQISIYEHVCLTQVLLIDSIYLNMPLKLDDYQILRSIIIQRYNWGRFTILCVYGDMKELGVYFPGWSNFINKNFAFVEVSV